VALAAGVSNAAPAAQLKEQEFFRRQYLSIRERSVQLVSRIAAGLARMTVHDINHLDALWKLLEHPLSRVLQK